MANDEQARYWNSDEAGHWLVHEERYERMLAPFTSHLLAAATVGTADRILDVGCGTGSTTRAAAAVAVAGEALGVDLSAPMLAQAVRRAEQQGVTNTRFEYADAQVHRFGRTGHDVAVSRFGAMFFADPAAAFANIAGGLRPGGRLVFVCWQNLADNDWVTVPAAAAARHVALPPPQDPTGPGPFSLGERDRIAAVLGAAQFTDVTIEPVTEPLWIGSDVPDAAAFLMATRVGKSLLEGADPPTAARIGEAVQAALERHATEAEDGVRLGSRAWLVTAHRPECAAVSGP